jgi:hypothetical protein
MTTTIATAKAAMCSAADWSETLEAASNIAYVTNAQLIPDAHTPDRSAQITLNGSTSAQTDTLQFTLTPRFVATRYEDEHFLDLNTGRVDAALVWKLERGQLTFSAGGVDDSTLTSELGLTGLASVNRRHEFGDLGLAYQYLSTERLSWVAQASWAATRYSDAERFGLTNYDYTSLQSGPSWSFSERLQGTLLFEGDRVSPAVGSIQDEYSVNAQLKHALTEGFTWRVSVGASQVDSHPGTGRSGLFEVGATRQTQRIQWDLSLRQAVAPIGLGLLARTDQATLTALANTSEHSTLSLSLAGIRSYPVTFYHFVVYDGASWGQLSGDWQWHFSRRWSATVDLIEQRSRQGSYPWAVGNQARIGVLWQSDRL